jgi:hypothetical protein
MLKLINSPQATQACLLLAIDMTVSPSGTSAVFN